MLLDIMPYIILYKWGEDKHRTPIIQKAPSSKEGLPHPLRMGEEVREGVREKVKRERRRE